MESASDHPPSWSTVDVHRRVLAVVHNVTAATRLLDVLDLLARDFRIQVEFTVIGSSAFTAGTERFLVDRGIEPISWDAATRRPYDLAISASYGGDLHDLRPPLITLPHGMGYNKYLNREKTNRETGEPVFGLSPDWLLANGKVLPASLVLSHPEQLGRLARSCPEAGDVAVVAGDPCFDRLLASVPLRAAYRRALGVGDTQRLVLISSTWGAESLYGAYRDVVGRLAADLPLDEYRIAVALHPNVWHWHSRWSVRMWSESVVRSGVLVLAPEEGWRAALVAADIVIGDHGSVTFYGAALGRPALLASAPQGAVAPDSAVGAFLASAPRLALDRPLAAQLDTALRRHDPAREPLASITGMATSAPGSAMALLRAEFYRLLDLPEPDSVAETRAVPLPPFGMNEPGAQLVSAVLTGDAAARVSRRPAELQRLTPGLPDGTHLSVDLDEPYRRFLDLAEIVVVPDARDAATVLAELPGCLLATGPLDARSWLVVCSDGRAARFTGSGAPGRVAASLVHAWLAAGRRFGDLPGRVSLTVGHRVHDLDIALDVSLDIAQLG